MHNMQQKEEGERGYESMDKRWDVRLFLRELGF